MHAMDSGKAPGLLYLEGIIAGRTQPPPYAVFLGMRLTVVGQGMARFEMPVSRDLYNPNQVVHGGAITSLLDSAMGLAVVSTLGEAESFTTAELKVNFLRAVVADRGPLVSEGRVVHRGRQLVVAEADCYDVKGQLVARASSTNLILPRRGAANEPGDGRESGSGTS
jgi:uncharacterized protein (TIGR00369 family)